MKVLAISSLYKPYSRGGAEVIFQSVVDELKKEHEVAVITICPWGGTKKLRPTADEEDGIRVYRFFPLNVFSFIDIAKQAAIVRLFWHMIDMVNLHTYVVVKGVIKKENPDLILTHNVKGLGYTALTAVRCSGKAHIHTLHDIQLVVPSGLRLYGQKLFGSINPLLWFYKTINKMVIGSPKVVVSPSRFLKNFYQRNGFFEKSHVEVLANPFEMPTSIQRRQKSPEKTVFFCIGQLEVHKGIQVLLRAFTSLQDKNSELHIAGKGSLEELVREAARQDSRIKFLSSLNRDQIPGAFAEVDFTVLPTLCYENSPMVVLESLGYGVPVIVFDIGGAAEFVREGENGWKVPPADESTLVQVMQKAMQITNYEQMSQAAHLSVSNISMKDYIQKIVELSLP